MEITNSIPQEKRAILERALSRPENPASQVIINKATERGWLTESVPQKKAGIGEALATGLGQGITLGHQEEMSAPFQKRIAHLDKNVGGIIRDVGSFTGLKGVEEFGERGIARGQATLDVPTSQLVEEHRADIAQVREDRPVASAIGQIVGAAVPGSLLAIAAPASPVLAGAGLGAIAGLGESEKESLEQTFKDVAVGTAVGGAFGGIGKAATSSANAVKKASTSLGRRAIGAIKSVVNKMGGPSKTDDVVNVLLDNQVIKGSMDDIAANVGALRDRSGQFIGDTLQILDDAGFKDVLNGDKLARSIRNTKVKGTNLTLDDYMRTPLGSGVKRQYDNLVQTAADPAFSNGTFKAAQDLKGLLQQNINFAKDQGDKNLTMRAYFAVRDQIDDAVEKAAPQIGDAGLARQFKQAKEAYGAAKNAEIAIDESMRRATGNKLMGLADWISFSQGDPLTGALTTGAKKNLRVYQIISCWS